jgi:FG-GAP repeat
MDRARIGTAVFAALVLAGLVGGSARATPGGHVSPSGRAGPLAGLQSDFNGDGYADLAISDFGYTVDSVVSAGAVSVIYGSATGLTSADNQLWTENSPGLGTVAESVDLWGRGLSSADFNGDGYDDLAVGDGNKDVDGVVDSGITSVIYGGPTGLDAFAGPGAQVWSENSPGMPTQAVCDDNFGRSTFGADFDGDGYDDLAIGIAYKDVGLLNAAGAMAVIYGGPNGLDVANGPGTQFWSQDSPDIEGSAEANGRFGWDLSSSDYNLDGYQDLATGSPGVSVNEHLGAGVFNVIYGGPNGLDPFAGPGDQLWTEDTPGINSDGAEGHDAYGRSLKSDDFDGDGYPDLAVGIPGEGVGSPEVPSAGAVNVIFGGPNGLDAFAGPGNQWWTRATPGVKGGGPQPNALFGRHLGVGDFNDDGFADLAIGVVAEDVQGIIAAGAVNVLYGSPNGLMTGGNSYWTQNTKGIQGISEQYDAMGRAVQGFDFDANGYDDLAIGVPGDTVQGLFAAGDVNVLLGGPTGVTAVGNRRWTLASPGILGDPQFGAIFGAGLVGLPAGSCGLPRLCNQEP